MKKRHRTTTATTTKSSTPFVVNEIVIKAPRRKVNDVGDWRKAMQAADGGRVQMLYDLLEDILEDGTLFDAVDKRINAVTNANLIFIDRDGNEVEEISDMIDSEEFEELVRCIMMSRMMGRSGVEIEFIDGKLVAKTIPQKHIHLEKKLILIDPTDEKGIPYEGDPQLIILGKPRQYGLVFKAALYAIYKRGGFGDWAQWVEIFGMPQRIGKYNSADPQSKKILEEALENAGSAQYIVVPKETDMELKDSNAGNGNSFNEFRKACNEEILVTILGQTLTTIAGDKGARSLGEVHKEGLDEKTKGDIRFVRRVLNSYLLPLLESRGFPVAGGRFGYPEAVKELTVAEMGQLSKMIAIPSSFLYEKYGIPTPEEGEEIAGSSKQTEEDPEQGKEEGKGKKPEEDLEKEEKKKQEAPKKVEEKLFDRAKRFFADAPTSGAGLQNSLMRFLDSITGTITLTDDYSIDLRKLLEEALKEIHVDPGTEISRQLFEINNDPIQDALAQLFAEPEFGEVNRDFVREFHYNTAVFTAFKSHAQTRTIVELLHDEEGRLRSFREFKKLALKVSKHYNEEWLRTEYNTAVRAARTAVNYRDALRTKHLYPNLEYLESTAKEKRQTHLRYVGTVLPIEHPWWDEHLPPSEWNCACSVKRTDKPVTPVPDEDEEDDIAPTFRNNPGKTAEFVKLKEHPFLRGKGFPSCPECRRMGIAGKTKLNDEKQDNELCPMHRRALLEAKLRDDLVRYAGWKFNRIKIGKGEVRIPEKKRYQNKTEQAKNEIAIKHLVKETGRKIMLLPVVNDKKGRNPDCYDRENLYFIDVKCPTKPLDSGNTQSAVREAAHQGACEVVIDTRKFGIVSSKKIKKGIRAAVQGDRAEDIKLITIIYEDRIETIRADIYRDKRNTR